MNDEDKQENVDDPEMVQHIEEAKDSAHQILDTASKEQAEKQKREAKNMEVEEVEEEEEKVDSSADLPVEEESVKDVQEDIEKLKPEKKDANKGKKDIKSQHPEGEFYFVGYCVLFIYFFVCVVFLGDLLEQMETCEIEGEDVLTSTVQRGNESTHHVQYGELEFAAAQPASAEEISCLRADIEKQLAEWREVSFCFCWLNL